MAKLALLGGEKLVTKPFPSWPVVDESDAACVREVILSGKWYRYSGTKNDELEKTMCEYFGAKYALTLTNGTAAIETPLAILGIGPGDEVIVPTYTFYSTASAPVFVGATPVFCDVDPDTFNLDIAQLESLVTPRTRAIIPVHFGGLPCDMDALLAFAQKHGLHIIEDCSHAHGTEYNHKKVGTLGKAGTYSFQNSKNLTSGEGGMVITDDEQLYLDMVSRHTCGRAAGGAWYEHHNIASNLRMTEMQAALLLNQFARLEEQTAERTANAGIINRALDGIPGLARCQHEEAFSTRRAYHLFCFRYEGFEGVSRDTFLKALSAEGVPCSPGYPIPLHRQPAFARVQSPSGVPYGEIDMPGVDTVCAQAVWFTQNLLLGDESNGQRIADALCKVAENAGELRGTEASV